LPLPGRIWQVRNLIPQLAGSGRRAGELMSEIICGHCDLPISGKAYRVISEEDGVVLLDMIVCERCRSEAQLLGLKTEELGSLPSAAERQ
jgi:hypothetical protein